MWRLKKQLPGRRTSGQRWVDHAADLHVDELGMTSCVECPCFFQSLNGVAIELHMDDFHGAGPLEACSEVTAKLEQHLKLRAPRCWSPR